MGTLEYLLTLNDEDFQTELLELDGTSTIKGIHARHIIRRARELKQIGDAIQHPPSQHHSLARLRVHRPIPELGDEKSDPGPAAKPDTSIPAPGNLEVEDGIH